MEITVWLIVTILFIKLGHCDEYCPKKCICEKSGTRWLKLNCGGTSDFINTLNDIDFNELQTNILQINLTSNRLSSISGLDLPNLRKLNASYNQINDLNVNTFLKVPAIKQLDLSHNLITKIKKDTFKNLNSLKQIDVSDNPLICDCDLLETKEWLQNHSIKLLSNPKCTFPKLSKSQYLKKLKIGVHLECGPPATTLIEVEEKATIRLHPAEDQIVFEGDPLKLNCLASGVHHAPENIEGSDALDATRVSWSLLDKNVDNQFTEIENRYLKYGGVIDSSLYISKLNRNHTGQWKCQLLFQNQTATQTRTILVIVISNVTKYCPITVTNNNKGIYTWPKTIAGYTVDIPCQLNENMKAYHVCSFDGKWLQPNTTQCTYISEITRILEQFSKVNLTITKVNALDSATHLKNYTSDLTLLKDKIDVIFIARTIRNYLDFLSKEKEVAQILAEITNNVQQLPRGLLEQANEEDGSCLKLIEAMEVVNEYISIEQTSFAAHEHKINRDVFLGMTCTWYTEQTSSGVRKNPELKCSPTRDTWQPVLGEKMMEASIQIPVNFFNQLIPTDRVVTSQRMSIWMYSTGKLFPTHLNNTTDVYTSVVGIKLINLPVTNLSTPVYVMMRIADGPGIPAVWDPTFNNGTGGWNTKGCQLSHYLHENMVVFTCNYLGYYAVLQDVQYLEDRNVIENVSGAKFRLSHPAAYIGGFVLFICMLLSIVTYLLCYSSIQMAKKAKHSLINMWIAMIWLCFIYTFGIYQTEDVQVCQAVGIIIHYLTLSVLLWMCVAVSNMYKRLNKSEPSAILTDDSLQAEQPVQKPILGLYLIGWGVALIVCGISGAVNMREYASYSFCFLDSPPALSAVFIPVMILLIAICVFLLMIRCAIRNADTQMTQLSEGTQGTENLDLDLLEPNMPNCGNISVKSASTSSSMIEDCEHAPMTQLRAHLIVLIIYMLMWTCAAISTTHPFNSLVYEEDLFNILYAVMASALGMFILFFYCIARSDVRTEWMNIKLWTKKRQFCCRSRSISDTRPNPTVTVTHATAEVQVTSRSSSRNSSQPKSISHQSNNLKGAAGLNEESTKTGNVDLVVLHRQQYRTNNTIPIYELSSMNGAEIFYNPHQIGVAKKFFRKQKRNMMKHNNLGTRHSRDNRSVKSHNSDMSSSLFGPGVKVNNTNIHIEQIKDTKHSRRNPNILSDNYNDIEYQNRLSTTAVQQLLVARKVKSNKKSKNNTNYDPPPPPPENMRTVSQQCSLEYSSETMDIGEEPPKSEPKIYVNPMENLPYTEWNKTGSLRSSLSTSDVDELYSQIRHGRNRNNSNKSRRHTLDEKRLAEMEKKFGGPSCTSSPTRRSETRL